MKKLYIILAFLMASLAYSQQEYPIYTDYLTDNYFLLHPSAAGMGNLNKIRFTARQQWANYSNSPALQTLGAFFKFNDETAMGINLYNDKTGHFSTIGGGFTYTYHLFFGNRLNRQISFGLSGTFQNSSLNTSDFENMDATLYLDNSKLWFYNLDVSLGYRNQNFYSFYTLKNLSPQFFGAAGFTTQEYNYRLHLLSFGYFFAKKSVSTRKKINPSFLIQYKEGLGEWVLDSNIKVFLPFKKTDLWTGFSYRTNLNKVIYENPTYISGFIGGKRNNFVFAYTYTLQTNQRVFSTSGFHQITLGYNFFYQRKEERFFDL